MHDGDALLRAIIANPGEDTPRLAYADWLDERGEEGDAERAEFIRLQVWLWANPACGSCSGAEWAAGKLCAECRRREALRDRQADLLDARDERSNGANWLAWAGPIPETGILLGAPWRERMSYARGFVNSLACRADQWLTHADALRRHLPLERVTLTEPFSLSAVAGLMVRAGCAEGLPIPLSRLARPDDLPHLLARAYPGIGFGLSPQPRIHFAIPRTE